ncbi:MAG TPA: hypothetical protein PK771_02915 [Spirochaetota bacterium]|nr:hypothetical protein [Spirochaetota bacterium]
MRKIFFVILALVYCQFLFNAEEIMTDISKFSNEQITPAGFETLLPALLGKNIVVFLANGDVSFSGKLVKVYNDGLIIENYLKKNLFILKNSIAIIEIKDPSVIKKK